MPLHSTAHTLVSPGALSQKPWWAERIQSNFYYTFFGLLKNLFFFQLIYNVAAADRLNDIRAYMGRHKDKFYPTDGLNIQRQKSVVRQLGETENQQV
jgi:hypothetical protein